MKMTKRKGTIGELKVAQELIERNFYVFTDISDNAPIDLIAVEENNLNNIIRVQVKTTTSKDNKAILSGRRDSSGYNGSYSCSDFDVFALYVIDKDIILYVPISDVINDTKKSPIMEIRFTAPKNNQKNRINWYEDYLDLII